MIKFSKKYNFKNASILLISTMIIFSSTITLANTDSYKSESLIRIYTDENNETIKSNLKTLGLGWLGYDDGVFNGGIGLTNGGTFQGAIRFTPTELDPYCDCRLSVVRFYHYVIPGTSENHNCILKIYEEGTTTTPGALIYSKSFTATGTGWIYVNLCGPVIIDCDEDLWISIQVTHEASESPLGVDGGPAIVEKGDFVFLGSSWNELRNLGLDYNWMINAYIDCDMTHWFEQSILLASDGKAGDHFGYSVSISGDYALIGAVLDSRYLGSAYIFKRNGIVWSEQALLLPSGGSYVFGISVSIDGDYALVGAMADNGNAQNSGATYIFKRDGTTWPQQSKLYATDGASQDEFGFSVSICGDYAIIGAPKDDDNGDCSGSAYVFIRSGTSWTQQAKLLPLDGTSEDFFGWSVSIKGDYAIVGAINDSENGYLAGAAYIFKRNGTTWSQQDKLLGNSWNYFGYSVSIDGDYALIGGMWGNKAYIFKREGTNWIEQQELTASTSTNDFGSSVSLDGDQAIIGAPGDSEYGNQSGAAFIFKRSGSTWIELVKLLPSEGAIQDSFGYSVSIDSDYTIIGVVEDDDNGDNSGSAYVFYRNNCPPDNPSNPIPYDGATNVGLDEDLSWTCIDPDEDTLTYDVYFGTISSPPLVSSGQSANSYNPGMMNPNTHYYWKIIAEDNYGGTTTSSIWDFITEEKPNSAPNKPDTPYGQIGGDINVEYTYTSTTTDIDEDQIFYWFDWGDGTNSGWVGPYDSGITGNAKHKWTTEGTYNIRVKAKDTFDAESEWSDSLSVTMPRTVGFRLFLLQFFEHYPNMFPILKYLIGL